jgi:death-on-curing protein
MSDWQWLDKAIILAVHDRQISEHGGGQGIRDGGLLESALNRPVNLAGYGEPEVADLAAAYAFGIARNHPFVDGNKRTAWVAARLFLMVNAVEIQFDKVDATIMMQCLAAGDLSENEVARWFRDHIMPKA